MNLPISRRGLLRAGSVALTIALTLAPMIAPPPAGSAFASDARPIADAKRLVSIGGSLTEIIYALGEEGRLVARDSTGQYPDAAMKLPDVGYMRRLSPEGVLSVDPDAIIALEGSGPPEAIDVLAKASVPMVMVPERFDRDGIVDKVRAVGEALGVEDKAAGLASEVGAELDAAQALTEGLSERKRILFVLSLQGGKIMASGSNSAADGIIKLAGGVNAITGFEGYKQLTDEAVIEARPDVVLMMARSDGLEISEDELFGHPAIAPTPAAANRELVRMNGLYLLGFGPRTASAARDLAVRLYGDKISN
ncbi:ABC transporter substrate-binding protein [Nitratireductor mangrovi]|uniref:ABC transporter substrate-binding protein n=1 Tax=Nitratireductor mangrovi TaxID=2599600 RepID=A0A5B8L4V1_9HYPH|nr:ABC transporter substrate-binding protein [Nitratireductor mangrovi]QDZ02558.1 ABC transporter substrate-binding protein [Nitratireductor mangrovi]